MVFARIALLAAVALGATGAVAAGLGDYTAVTYNTQGAKWTDVVRLVPAYDIIALQEAGAHPDMWGKPTTVDSQNCTVGPSQVATFEVLEYTWKYGTGDKSAYVYYLESDAFGHRVNAAFVTKSKASKALVFCPQRDNTSAGTYGRPLLGIILPDNLLYFTTHAGSYGNNQYNDADNIVSAVNLAEAKIDVCWAILGDFNRDPAKLTVPQGARIIRSGKATQQKGGELDYMVAREKNCSEKMAAAVLNGMSSDHFPVAFHAEK
jgi:endonuclease/exonuclease/phosphatase family metal-dependent hydrolase